MKIVLVDDDCAFERSLDLVLSARGHQVTALNKPYDACIKIAFDGSVDALILDYAMPGMNGVEVLKCIQEFLPPQCKVIFISGHTDSLDTDRLLQAGAFAFLPKPLDINELIRLIEPTQSDDIGEEEVS